MEKNTPAALACLDELMAGLRADDEAVVDRVRDLLHDLVDTSNAAQLWCLCVPILKLMERDIGSTDRDESGLLACRRADVMKAKAAVAAGKADDAMYWLNQLLAWTLLSQAAHPMIRAGLGLTSSRPTNQELADWYEFGQKIRTMIDTADSV